LASTFCQQTTMMANRILVLFLGCFVLGAAEPSTTCDLPAEAGTEAVMLASQVVLDDAESSEGQGKKEVAERKRSVPGYELSPDKAMTCSVAGYDEITTAVECKEAAMAGKGASENWNWDGTRNWPNRLYGCLYCEPYGDVNFNINPTGEGISDDQVPLCAYEIPTTDADTSSAIPPPSITGDPHVVTSRGFKLDLNQPGDYTLLQVPHDGPALLRLEATVERSGMSCTFYITKARLLGAWFHEDTLKIRADNQDGQPFAIQMADAEPWASLPDISSNNETILKTYKHANVEVNVMAVRQTTKGAGSHKGPEGSFSVLVAKPEQPQAEQTIIKIAKGEHWLNIALTRLGNLGYSKMGGVLGTDVPNAKWTELPDDCKMFHELQGENIRRKDITAELEPNSDASILWY